MLSAISTSVQKLFRVMRLLVNRLLPLIRYLLLLRFPLASPACSCLSCCASVLSICCPLPSCFFSAHSSITLQEPQECALYYNVLYTRCLPLQLFFLLCCHYTQSASYVLLLSPVFLTRIARHCIPDVLFSSHFPPSLSSLPPSVFMDDPAKRRRLRRQILARRRAIQPGL